MSGPASLAELREDIRLQDASKAPSEGDIRDMCDTVRDMLLEKNRKYGDSALNPIRVFSQADPVEQIKVRMDDKLSRARSRQGDDDEDVYLDLVGYLILLLVINKRRGK